MSTPDLSDKIVIAHRGASGYVPEHTMESKAMAHAMNVNFIEQDLVLSKDDIPIVIHDIYLEEVTNVSSIYPERSRDDGRYYVIDFTLDELKNLSVNERVNHETNKAVFPNRFPSKQTHFKLHTLQEEIEFIQGLNSSTGKQIGIYPEIKNPGFHKKQGKDISKIVLKILNDNGYQNKTDPCILQCFDAVELQRIREELNSNLFLVQLMELPEGTENIEKYALYADGVGPSIEQLIISGVGTTSEANNKLVDKAHKLGLKVHAYTFRADENLNFESFDDLLKFGFYTSDLDGVFTDFPDLVVDFLKE